jgi:hypothetical protein
MPYIGNDIQYGELNSQTFTGDGSTTAFTLTYTVSNVNSLLVTVADVIQEPTTAYTVSGTTLTFTSAPANLDTIHVRYLGRTLDVGTTAIVQDSDQDTLIQVEESVDEDTIRFDTGGTERVTINSTSVTSTIPLYIPDGSASTPSVTNTGDTNTGIFFPAADTVGVAVGGTEVWRYGSNPTTAKNLIINGAMTVSQRGTSFTALTDAYCLDQFIYIKDASTAVIDVTQSTDVPSGEGFGKSLKIDVTTADASIDANDLAKIQTPIEAQNLTQLKYGSAGAQTMTLSFWIKSTKTGTFNAFAYQPDGNRFYNASYTVNVTDTWEHKTVTISGDSSGTINYDTGTGLIVGWTLIAGTNWTGSADTWSGNADYAVSSYSMLDNTANNIYITGVQLEVGSVATDFEHEDYGTTLAKCQRYVWVVPTVNGDYICMGLVGSSTSTLNLLPLPVTMRAVPTLALSAGTHFGCIEIGVATRATTALSLDGASSEQLAVLAATVSSSGMATGEATILSSASASATMLLTAEL